MNIQRKSNNRAISGENRFGALWSMGWLADQAPEFQSWAADVGILRRVPAGQSVYRAGDLAQGVYGLRSGAVEVEFSLIGDEPISILRSNEGFWIGEAGLLSQQERLVSLIAVEDSSFMLLPGHEIRAFLEKAPEHWQAFFDLSHRNVGTALRLLAEALSLTVRARVCRRLLALSENRIEANTTQEALAKTLGIARPTLRRSLNSLAELGAIELRYRRVAILDRTVLEQFKDEQ